MDTQVVGAAEIVRRAGSHKVEAVLGQGVAGQDLTRGVADQGHEVDLDPGQAQIVMIVQIIQHPKQTVI